MELPSNSYDIHRPIEQEEILERCAEDFFYNHDGWESSWPVLFALHDGEDGGELCRLMIDREDQPYFFTV